MKIIKAETAQKKIIEALQVRIDNAPNSNFADNMRAELSQFSKPQALAVIEALQALNVDMLALSKRVAVHDKADKENYIAIYALQKVRKAMFALALKTVTGFDKYSHSIIKNLANLQALDNLNAQRSICSRIELDELQQAQAVKVYHNCSPSTASTQASSTRMMLQALNVCNVSKGSKADSISFTDSDISKAVQALYA